MFVKITNGAVAKFPYNIGELRRENPQTSFPQTIPDATLASYGVYRVTETTPPIIDSNSQRVTQSVQNVDGVWTQQWQVQDLPEDEASANNRAHRDRLLKATDHYGLSDVTMSADMATYRQALRDVPQQEGFPGTITWPTKPE
jgi:hypothetical protein